MSLEQRPQCTDLFGLFKYLLCLTYSYSKKLTIFLYKHIGKIRKLVYNQEFSGLGAEKDLDIFYACY